MAEIRGNLAYSAELVESYVDNLELLELKDNKIYKLAGTTKAKGPEHFWVKDVVRASQSPTDASKAEGRQFLGKKGTDVTRIYNTTQFFMEDIQVSGTVQRSEHIAVADRFALEAEKTEKAVAKDIERAMIYGVRDKGTYTGTEETVVRSMDGLASLISTYASSNAFDAAGEMLDEDLFQNYIQATWDNGDRSKDMDVFMGAKQKRFVSLFTSPNTRNIEAKSKMIVLPVDTISTDFGNVNLHLHRELAADDLLGLDTSSVYKAMLLAPKTEKFAKRGDSVDGSVMAELTIELRRPENCFYVGGLATAADVTSD